MSDWTPVLFVLLILAIAVPTWYFLRLAEKRVGAYGADKGFTWAALGYVALMALIVVGLFGVLLYLSYQEAVG